MNLLSNNDSINDLIKNLSLIDDNDIEILKNHISLEIRNRFLAKKNLEKEKLAKQKEIDDLIIVECKLCTGKYPAKDMFKSKDTVNDFTTTIPKIKFFYECRNTTECSIRSKLRRDAERQKEQDELNRREQLIHSKFSHLSTKDYYKARWGANIDEFIRTTCLYRDAIESYIHVESNTVWRDIPAYYGPYTFYDKPLDEVLKKNPHWNEFL